MAKNTKPPVHHLKMKGKEDRLPFPTALGMCHVHTCLRALTAGFRASTAMLHTMLCMLFTLFGASLANFGAFSEQMFCVLRSSFQVSGC